MDYECQKWQYLDFDNGRYAVKEALQNRYGVNELQEPKSTYSKAQVLITPACLGLLQTHQAQQAELFLSQGLTPSLIFPRDAEFC